MTKEPTALGDIFAGFYAQSAAAAAPRALRVVDRIGVQRGPLPGGMRVAVLIRDRYTCQWCRQTARGDGLILEIDHLVPWSAGGADHPVNLRTLCGPCNQDRSNRVTDLDRRALPVTHRCQRCYSDPAVDVPSVTAYCLTCRASGAAPYLGHLFIGGAIPDVGIPPLGAGDEDYVGLTPGLRPGMERHVAMLRARLEALAISCTWCGAPQGGPCVGSDGEPLIRSAAHPARLMGVADLDAEGAEHGGPPAAASVRPPLQEPANDQQGRDSA